jgi:hypothetical protein
LLPLLNEILCFKKKTSLSSLSSVLLSVSLFSLSLGNVFCSKCSDYKTTLPTSKKKERVRVCVNCFNEINQEVTYLTETLPILQRGETFKIKSLLGLSSKFITLRLMSDGRHLCYEEAGTSATSSATSESILLPTLSITQIIPTSFVSFDLQVSSSTLSSSKSTTYSFEAENKALQQTWIVSLKQLLEYSEKQHNFHTNNELLRQRKKIEMKNQLEQEELLAAEEAAAAEGGGREEEITRGGAKEQRKLTRDQIREKYGLNK